MGKTLEDVGRQTATSSLASDNDVKSETAASDMTSCSLRKKKNRRGKICGRRHGVSPYNHPPFKTVSPRCRVRNKNGMELKKKLRLGCVEVQLGVSDRSQPPVLERGLR